MMLSVVCWALFSVASQPILKRHSPLIVIGLAFSIGGALYITTLMPLLIGVNWRGVSTFSWLLMLASALLSLNLSYWIWYTGLKKLGGSRTSVYSYLTPIVAIGRGGAVARRADFDQPDGGCRGHFRWPPHHSIRQLTQASSTTRQRSRLNDRSTPSVCFSPQPAVFFAANL